MRDITTLAEVSYAVIAFLLIVPMSAVTLSAYRSSFAGRKFEYKFEKKRLPYSCKILLAELTVTFVYMLILSLIMGNDTSSSLGNATGFTLLALPVAALSCVMSICYVTLGSKSTGERSK